jgi:ligand-binding SRPBCC domain-containing protein
LTNIQRLAEDRSGMSASRKFSIASRLAVPAEQVWSTISTAEGVNAELRPWLRLTWPVAAARLGPADVPLGKRLFRSWILLFGVLPFDFDDLTLIRIDPGRGFLEESSMLSQRLWRHERRIEPAADGSAGCTLTDEVSFVPRLVLQPLAPLVLGICKAVFRWRHRQLRARFGTRLSASPGERSERSEERERTREKGSEGVKNALLRPTGSLHAAKKGSLSRPPL